MISDAAKEVGVESHVLRYWEEELKLPIRRNELGHRYYTKEDVERFKQIKRMKEKGLQLKAIKMILKDGKLNVLTEKETVVSKEYAAKVTLDKVADKVVDAAGDKARKAENFPGIEIVGCREAAKSEMAEISKEDKAQRLQWLLRQLIRETLQENNEALCHEIRNSVVKELDYQFRNLEDREEERELQRIHRDEAYYKKMDELLRRKSKGYDRYDKVYDGGYDKANNKGNNKGNDKVCDKAYDKANERVAGKENDLEYGRSEGGISRKQLKEQEKAMDIRTAEKKGKKKRHSIF